MTQPLTFAPAVKTQARLRLALEGGPGSGKSFTSQRIARGLVDSRPAVIDTEAGSASKYADLFGFDTLVLTSYEPQDYINAITAAENAGYEVVIIDSLSHEWQAVKNDVDRRKSGERNQFAAWREPKKAHEQLVEKIVQSRLHIIATMRSKVEYALDNSSGRAEVKRLGMAPIQQEEMPFHFDVIAALDNSHNLTITKSRIAELADKTIEKPGEELGKKLRAWLSEGAVAPTPQPIDPKDTATGRSGYRKGPDGYAVKDDAAVVKNGYVDTMPVLEGRIADATLSMIATMGRNAPEAIRSAFYDEFLEKRGFTGDTYAKKWKAFVERGSNDDAADAVTFLGVVMESA